MRCVTMPASNPGSRGVPMDAILDLVRESQRLVVFTGAGVSTLSGLPDFRGEDGIYRQIDGSRVFDIGVFHQDPAFFYAHGADLVYGLDGCEPSLVHRECARLEAAGKLLGVVTQNIDMLHQRAGSEAVVELHGSPATHTCVGCGRVQGYAWAQERVRTGDLPRCPTCREVLKPDITFFGEMLPPGALEQAAAWAAEADVLLVLGSTLLVQPAASIPMITARSGGELVIVNRDPTPLDHLAVARHGDLATLFERIATEI
ncbi:NAD-dependent deacetylase [bacterium]|nr:NAD-dependent deacetylase [bacterium]